MKRKPIDPTSKKYKMAGAMAGFANGVLGSIPIVGDSLAQLNSQIMPKLPLQDESETYTRAAGIGQATGNVAGSIGSLAASFGIGGLGAGAAGAASSGLDTLGKVSNAVNIATDVIDTVSDQFKMGGKVSFNKESSFKSPLLSYSGPKHKYGGIGVNKSLMPTSKTNAIAELEGGETSYKDYVFSEFLKDPSSNKSFAELSKKIDKKYKGKKDKISLESRERELSNLAKLNEELRMKEESFNVQKFQDGGSITDLKNEQNAILAAMRYNHAGDKKAFLEKNKDLIGLSFYKDLTPRELHGALHENYRELYKKQGEWSLEPIKFAGKQSISTIKDITNQLFKTNFKNGGKLPKYDGGGKTGVTKESLGIEDIPTTRYVDIDSPISFNKVNLSEVNSNSLTNSNIPVLPTIEPAKDMRLNRRDKDFNYNDKEGFKFASMLPQLTQGFTSALSTAADFALAKSNKPETVRNYYKGAMTPAINTLKQEGNLAEKAMINESRLGLTTTLKSLNEGLAPNIGAGAKQQLFNTYSNSIQNNLLKSRNTFANQLSYYLANQGQLTAQGQYMTEQINTQERDASRQAMADAFRNLEKRGYSLAQIQSSNISNKQKLNILKSISNDFDIDALGNITYKGKKLEG